MQKSISKAGSGSGLDAVRDLRGAVHRRFDSGQKHFYELRLQSLSQTINNQEARIQSLSQQLDSALKQVQDLAVKAIEGASNAKSSEAIKEIALEQAKQLKGK